MWIAWVAFRMKSHYQISYNTEDFRPRPKSRERGREREMTSRRIDRGHASLALWKTAQGWEVERGLYSKFTKVKSGYDPRRKKIEERRKMIKCLERMQRGVKENPKRVWFKKKEKRRKECLVNTFNHIYYFSFVCTQLNSFKYCYVSLTIQLNISHLFTHSWM